VDRLEDYFHLVLLLQAVATKLPNFRLGRNNTSSRMGLYSPQPSTPKYHLEPTAVANPPCIHLSQTAALDALMGVSELEFQSEPALEQALWLFKQTGAPDFADC